MTVKEIGDYGERVAAAYLKYKGYDVLQQNYRIRGGEIDIVAEDSEERYIFAEVKTRSHGIAAESVDRRKQERLVRTAIAYLGREDVDMRFDVIEVYYRLSEERMIITRINHIQNAFQGA